MSKLDVEAQFILDHWDDFYRMHKARRRLDDWFGSVAEEVRLVLLKELKAKEWVVEVVREDVGPVIIVTPKPWYGIVRIKGGGHFHMASIGYGPIDAISLLSPESAFEQSVYVWCQRTHPCEAELAKLVAGIYSKDFRGPAVDEQFLLIEADRSMAPETFRDPQRLAECIARRILSMASAVAKLIGPANSLVNKLRKH